MTSPFSPLAVSLFYFILSGFIALLVGKMIKNKRKYNIWKGMHPWTFSRIQRVIIKWTCDVVKEKKETRFPGCPKAEIFV